MVRLIILELFNMFSMCLEKVNSLLMSTPRYFINGVHSSALPLRLILFVRKVDLLINRVAVVLDEFIVIFQL